jgi:phosphatidylinositol glycan class Z
MKIEKLYILFVILRGVLIFTSGYIHPDEFFQSPEITAADVFSYQTEIPWEFKNRTNPCRTISIPYDNFQNVFVLELFAVF